MCRLQHSLGIVWRPQIPPLTAPTSNQSEQPCRQGPGATGPSSHARRSRSAKASLGPRARARRYEGLLGAAAAAAWDRKVQDRGGRRDLRLSSLGQVAGPRVPGDRRALQVNRIGCCREALRSCPAGRAEAALAWVQPWGPEATSLAFLSAARPCL